MEHDHRSISRRALMVGGVAVTAGLVAAPSALAAGTAGAAGSEGAGRGVYAERAQETYRALQRYFYDPETSLYLEEYPRRGVLLLEQAGMVRIEGMLAWLPRDYARLT